jgi:hypothetical protein
MAGDLRRPVERCERFVEMAATGSGFAPRKSRVGDAFEGTHDSRPAADRVAVSNRETAANRY